MGVELVDSPEPVEVSTETARLVGVLGVQLQLGAGEGHLWPLQDGRAIVPAPQPSRGGSLSWGVGVHLTRALSSPFHMKVSISRTLTFV